MSDFGFDGNLSSILPKRGAFVSLSFSVIRELTVSDIMRLGDGGKLAHKPIQQIRAIHHRLAQLLAQGLQINEVSAITGSSIQRIDKLKADPTFNDLLTYYQDQIGTEAIEDGKRIQEKLKTAAETALDEINERLMDDKLRAEMPIAELRKITELGADRTVAPPKASVHLTTPPQQITLNIGAPRFAETNSKTTITENQSKITDLEIIEEKNINNNEPNKTTAPPAKFPEHLAKTPNPSSPAKLRLKEIYEQKDKN